MVPVAPSSVSTFLVCMYLAIKASLISVSNHPVPFMLVTCNGTRLVYISHLVSLAFIVSTSDESRFNWFSL